MSDPTYSQSMSDDDKPVVWLHGKVRSPPFSAEARLEAGYLLRSLQRGDSIGMPHSRPLPVVGPRCHELRIRDRDELWRIVYRLDTDAVVILEVFSKKTQTTPKKIIDACRRRLKHYDTLGNK